MFWGAQKVTYLLRGVCATARKRSPSCAFFVLAIAIWRKWNATRHFSCLQRNPVPSPSRGSRRSRTARSSRSRLSTRCCAARSSTAASSAAAWASRASASCSSESASATRSAANVRDRGGIQLSEVALLVERARRKDRAARGEQRQRVAEGQPGSTAAQQATKVSSLAVRAYPDCL